MKIKSLLAILTLSTQLFSAQLITLSGDKNYPPYSYEENGIAKGVYVDILKSAFSKMKEYDLEIKMMAYKRAIKLTQTGKTIGFFPPYYGIERTKWTKFSEPILAETMILFAKEKTLENKQNYPEDYYGLTACLNRGFSQTLLGGEKFAKAVQDGKIKLIEANDNQGCLSRVERGLADFYVNDQLVDISKFKNIHRGPVVVENFGHVGFTLIKQDYPYIDEFEKKFNIVIKQMKENGEIQKILENYK